MDGDGLGQGLGAEGQNVGPEEWPEGWGWGDIPWPQIPRALGRWWEWVQANSHRSIETLKDRQGPPGQTLNRHILWG